MQSIETIAAQKLELLETRAPGNDRARAAITAAQREKIVEKKCAILDEALASITPTTLRESRTVTPKNNGVGDNHGNGKPAADHSKEALVKALVACNFSEAEARIMADLDDEADAATKEFLESAKG